MFIKRPKNTMFDPFLKEKKEQKLHSLLRLHKLVLFSKHLHRRVKVDVYLLEGTTQNTSQPALLINDGQDMKRLDLINTLTTLYATGRITRIVTVAVHADKNRHQEYGTAEYLDYKKRGELAARYSQFITLELVPFLQKKYDVFIDPALSVFAGFSLGGLSALDISWRNPDLFLRVGVFSGSLWWRYKGVDKKEDNPHRIMHHIVSNSSKREGMQFWFEAGTEDETEDRNNSGTIDAIEDTKDLIQELKVIGYTDREITFRLIKGGHNFKTWAKIFPDFLVWACG